MSATEFAAPPHGGALVFDSKLRGGDLIGLSFKNALLNIVTLSLYRFWATTEVRRRVWAGTTLNGEPLEYTGRGMELFKGFLIAAVVVGVPLVILSVLSALLGPVGAILTPVVFYMGLFALMGVAIFTSFRYRASRTTWRGVRFQLVGSPVSYAKSYFGYLLLGMVTLGWFWPAAQRRLAAPLWGGLRFGDRAFSFDLEAARKVKVYPAYVAFWLAAMPMYVVLTVMSLAAAGAEGAADDEAMGAMAVLIALGVLIALPVFAVVGSIYQAAMLRAIAAGVRLGDVRFELNAKWADLLTLWLTNAFVTIVSFGVFTPIAQMRTVRFVVQRLKAVGEVDLSTVRQVERGPKTGEGLTDLLDLAPI